MHGAVSLRNLWVHDFISVEDEVVAEGTEDLQDVLVFVTSFPKWMEQQ
jgi:uncharacterized protein YutE (UPF0331/DUF86 family)